MKKITFNIILVLLLLSGCSDERMDSDKLTIAVSIAPQKTFVEMVSGDKSDVVVMIPAGNSPANYQPSPKQMGIFDTADLYFSIGVAAESNIKPLIKNSDISKIFLEEIVEEKYPDRYFNGESHSDDDHDHEGRDPHIWLSPKRVKIMITAIRDELSKIDPENKELYESNALSYLKELDELDEYLRETFDKLEKKEFIIYHPSFGYFADDYDLEMITIEEDGKEATARKLEEVIDFAIDHNIKFILYQEEFDKQQAELIAKEINGSAIKVSPLSEDYIDNLKNIANQLRDILN